MRFVTTPSRPLSANSFSSFEVEMTPALLPTTPPLAEEGRTRGGDGELAPCCFVGDPTLSITLAKGSFTPISLARFICNKIFFLPIGENMTSPLCCVPLHPAPRPRLDVDGEEELETVLALSSSRKNPLFRLAASPLRSR